MYKKNCKPFFIFLLVLSQALAQDSENPEISAQDINPTEEIVSDTPSEEIPVEAPTKDITETETKSEPAINNEEFFQITEEKNNAKYLSLQEALDIGLKRNASQEIRNFRFSTLNLDWQDAYQNFWFPQLNLTLNNGSQLTDKWTTDNTMGTGTPRSPNGYVGLEFEEYTIFNWGKDYLDYLNNKTVFSRGQQILDEEKRRLRFDIIENYFNLSRLQTLIQYRKEQLRQTSFLYRLVREKVGQRKLKTQELFQIKEEFLRAQTEYQELLNEYIDAQRVFAKLIFDNYENPVRTSNLLLFKTLSYSRHDAIKVASMGSPLTREARKDLDLANRNFEKNLKDRLPLPRFSVKLGAYRHQFSDTGLANTYSTGDGGRNVELVASVNMSWKIFGDGGWFNERDNQRIYLQKRVAETSFLEAQREVHAGIQALTRQSVALERKISAAQSRLANAQKTYDKVLDNYLGGQTEFPHIKLILDSLKFSQNELENSKLNHLATKLNLAHLVGLEDFPADNFETLVLK